MSRTRPRRLPLWEVTWPIRPSGTNSVLVRAEDPTDAVRVAAELGLPLGDDLSMAFDYEPEVWRMRHPYRWRSHHAAGPEYGAAAPGEVGFMPLPLGTETV